MIYNEQEKEIDYFADYKPVNGDTAGNTASSQPVASFDNSGANDVDHFADYKSSINRQQQSISGNSAAQGADQRLAQEDMGAFMAGVVNFNRVFGSMAEGAIDLFAKATGSESIEQAVGQVAQKHNDEVALARQQHPVASLVGTGLGVTGAAVLPGGALPKGASLAQKMATGAKVSAAYSGLNYAPTMEERFDNAVAGGIVGMAFPAVAPYVVKGAQAWDNAWQGVGETMANKPSGFLDKILTPKSAAAKDIALELKNAGNIDDVMNNTIKFSKSGVPSTLADVASNPGINATLKSIPMDIESRGLLQKARNAQNKAISSGLDQSVENLVPGGQKANDQLTKDLYTGLQGSMIPDDIQIALISDESLAHRMKGMNQNLDLKIEGKPFKDIPDNALTKWDMVKRQIDDEMYNNVQQLKNKESTMMSGVRASLRDSRNKLVETLDSLHPEYAAARQASERGIYYKKFQDALKKPAFESGSNNKLTLDQKYKTLWGTPERQEYFLDAVKNTGGDPTAVKDLMDIMNLTKDSILDKMIKSPNKNSKAPYAGANTAGIMQQMLHNITSSRYEKAFLKTALEGNRWQPILKKVMEKPELEEKLSGIEGLFEEIMNSKPGQAVKNTANKMLKSELRKQVKARLPSKAGLLYEDLQHPEPFFRAPSFPRPDNKKL